MNYSNNNSEWTTVTYKKKRSKNNNEKQISKTTQQPDYIDKWEREFSTPLKYKCKKIEYE